MSTSKMKKLLSYSIMIFAVAIGLTLMISDTAAAQVAQTGAVIVRPGLNASGIDSDQFIVGRPGFRPGFRPIFRPIFNPFQNRFIIINPFNRFFFDPFFLDDDALFFGFGDEAFLGDFERDD